MPNRKKEAGGCLLPTLVDADGWFDIGRATGRSLYRLPTSLVNTPIRGDPREAVTHCNTVCAAYGDATVDPRSGGVIGLPGIAEALGRSESRTRRILRTDSASFVRRCGDVPASNQASLEPFKTALDESAFEEHRAAGRKGGRPATDVSGGSGPR